MTSLTAGDLVGSVSAVDASVAAIGGVDALATRTAELGRAATRSCKRRAAQSEQLDINRENFMQKFASGNDLRHPDSSDPSAH